jgi:hypothetical protein
MTTVISLLFAAILLGACTTQETTIVGPDCHATASADGGGGGGGSATGEGGAGAPGGAAADSGCTGGSVASK